MDLHAEAMKRFHEEFARAATCGLKEPTAMTLATASRDGRPAIRTVLLKDADERGFVFFTNLESRKGLQLAANGRAALCFYWPPLDKQVIVEGTTSLVTDAEADAYWNTRPRDSQIGAWASLQSRPLARREELLERVATFTKKHEGGPVPRPPHWTGVRVAPDRIEFWTAMPYRLHDRTIYEKTKDGWTKTLAFP